MNHCMKTLLFAFLLLLIPVLAHAQDSTRVGVVSRRFFQIDFQPGYLRGDLSSINNSLRAYGYNPMGGNMLTYTLSAKLIIRRFVLDFGIPFFGRPTRAILISGARRFREPDSTSRQTWDTYWWKRTVSGCTLTPACGRTTPASN